MEQYILGVCIPTFNRRKIVEECVNKLLSYNLPIEIVVSDNASTDGTYETLAEIKDERLKLYKQNDNVGASFNIHTTFMKSTAKYSILISDEEDLDEDTLRYLIDYFKGKEDIGVFLGSGIVLNGKNKTYSDYEYDSAEAALFDLGFKTRYMSGIVMNINLYKKHVGHVPVEKSAYYFDTYSFMYAEAKLMCYGKTVTSEKILYRQSRKAKTSATNNADEKVYYYEPEGRKTQLCCWMRCVNELPLSDSFKQKLCIKLIFDAIILSFRCLLPKEIEMIKDIATQADFINFCSHTSLCTKENLISEILMLGLNYMVELEILHGAFDYNEVNDVLQGECLQYYLKRLEECNAFEVPEKEIVDIDKLISSIEGFLPEKEKVEYIGVNFDGYGNSKSKIYLYDTTFIGKTKCANIPVVSYLYENNMIKHSDVRYDNHGVAENVFNFCLSYMNMSEYDTFVDLVSKNVSTIKNSKLAQFLNLTPVFDRKDMSSIYYLGVNSENGEWNSAKMYYRSRDIVDIGGRFIYKLDNNKYLKYFENAGFKKIECVLPCIKDLMNEAGLFSWMTGVDVNEDGSEKFKYYLVAPKKDYDTARAFKVLKKYMPISTRIGEIDKYMKLSIVAISCDDKNQIGVQLYYVF